MQFFDGNCSDFLFSLFSGYLQNVIICDKNLSIIWHVEESPRSKAMVILLTENGSEILLQFLQLGHNIRPCTSGIS